jgi:hypothetical protein
MKMPIDAAQLQGTNSATHAWVDLGYRAKKKHFGLASTYHTYHIPAPGDKHADIVPSLFAGWKTTQKNVWSKKVKALSRSKVSPVQGTMSPNLGKNDLR